MRPGRSTARWATAPLMIGLLPGIAHALTKTIAVVPNLAVNAVTTWYYLNCTTVLGVGSYTENVKPKHGSLSFGEVSAPLPGCPQGSPSLPAAQASYTWTDTTSGASSDFFQLTYEVNGLSEIENITVNLTTLQITFNGVIVTSPQMVALGQQVNLGINLTPTTSNSVDWVIPGDDIGGYNPSSPCPSSAIPLVQCVGAVIPTPSLNQPSITFYWIKPGTFEVHVRVLLNKGKYLSAKAMFEAVGPTNADIVVSYPGLTALLPSASPTTLSCGTPATPTSMAMPCIHFDASIPSSPYQYDLEFVQVILLDVDEVRNEIKEHYSCSAGAGLDNEYPYPTLRNSSGGFYTNDSPDIALTPIEVPLASSHNVQFRAEMFLMWRAVIANATSIFVPVGSREWEWRAKAKLISGTWTLESDSVSASRLRSPAYPTWLSVTLNSDALQCTLTP